MAHEKELLAEQCLSTSPPVKEMIILRIRVMNSPNASQLHSRTKESEFAVSFRFG